ncbi:hypothetical protein QE406_002893 [Microbacterium testaceum]|nr:hypothetical protein [Microbacterium testaceum]
MLELDLTADIQALRSTFADIQAVVDVDALKADIDRLSEEAGAPDLWDDVDNAQKVTSRLSHRQAELKRIAEIEQRLDDLEVLVELAIEMDDEDSADEARRELASLKDVIGQLEVQTLLDGEYDSRSAVVTIRSGAGGDDATDFAEMLLRMYLRWAERHKYPVKVMDTSYAEGAGIKSATFEVDVPYAYGTLSVEAGTHRLARISPFGGADKRQTSFAAVEVIPVMEEAVEVEVPEGDIRVDVFRSSGPGRSVGEHDRLGRAHHAHPHRPGRLDAEREVADPEPRRGHARSPDAPAPAQARRRSGQEERARRDDHRELGRPDALVLPLRPAARERPAHRLRGRQPRRRVRRGPRRSHRGRNPLAQAQRRRRLRRMPRSSASVGFSRMPTRRVLSGSSERALRLVEP